MAFTKRGSGVRVPHIAAPATNAADQAERLRRLRMAELDSEFARQARTLAKLTRELRTKLRNL